MFKHLFNCIYFIKIVYICIKACILCKWNIQWYLLFFKDRLIRLLLLGSSEVFFMTPAFLTSNFKSCVVLWHLLWLFSLGLPAVHTSSPFCLPVGHSLRHPNKASSHTIVCSWQCALLKEEENEYEEDVK